MTELAKQLIEDGQPLRAIESYLNQTFRDIEGKKFISRIKFLNVDESKINDPAHLASCAVNDPLEIDAIRFFETVIDSASIAKRYFLEQKINDHESN